MVLETTDFRLERIVSTGHVTPPGEWYDQDASEWVIVLGGRAGLRFEDEPEPRVLQPGDHVLIEPHRRHRVEWTDPDEPTVWLALHYGPGLAVTAERPGAPSARSAAASGAGRGRLRS